MTSKHTPADSRLLRGDPRLVVGWRTRGGLDGRRLDVHRDAHAPLREISQNCLTHIDAPETRIRDYEPFGAIEAGEEVFRLDLDSSSTLELDSASIVRLVQSSHSLERLPARDLANHHYAFYAIVWGGARSRQTAFVRKSNARRTLEKGARFFRYQDTLIHVDSPDFVLEETVDLVLRGTDLYMLNEFSARTLLSDTSLAQQTVADNIVRTKAILGGEDRITPSATAAFTAVARRKVSVAARLAKIPAFFEGVVIDSAKLRKTAEGRFADPNPILDAKGVICADEAHVEDALDLIEGRLYQDETTGEERRADRTSRRNK